MPSDVLLVNMPFVSLRWPALGISLLKASLHEAGIGCDVVYANFDFAELIGRARYEWLNDAFGFVLGGERVFARELYPEGLPDEDRYVAEVLRGSDPAFSCEDEAEYRGIAAWVSPFLHHLERSVDWGRYAVVGFSTTFQQTLSSLLLARRIKEAHAHVHVVFGGANCEGEMGAELLRQFPFVDFVISGEADHVFPQLVKELLQGGVGAHPRAATARSPSRLVCAGSEPVCELADRRAGSEARGSARVPVLDRLPDPDFSDYFARLSRSPFQGEIEPLLLCETSRGCWWGERQPCTFCGLNGATRGFRSKSGARAVRELRALSRRYGVRRVCFTDNSLDRRAFREFLPRLTKARLDLQFEYEMRASLTRRQVRQLANAGLVAAQLGVESLSSNVLRLLRKGVLAVQNLQAMKWLSEAGVEVKWNFLYGVPREEPSDYERLPELLRSISHLPPPQAAGPVRLDRFSSYFESPDPFALTGLSPALAYRYVYPFSDDVLGRMAYYFRCDQMGSSQTPEYVQPVLAAIEDWRNGHDHARLWWISSSERSLTLRDTRSCASCFEHRLVGRECDLYLFCDAARSFRSIERFVASWEGMDRLNRVELRRVLDRWIQSRILVELDGRFLSLALEFPAE